MSQVTVCYRNILETGTVSVTTENASFPKYRLHDRDKNKLFKGTTNPAHFYITVDQGVSPQYDVNRVIIPSGHNLAGLTLKVQRSIDNFATPIDVDTWTGAAGDMTRSFTQPATTRYWRLDIAAPGFVPELPELVLGQDYVFEANPLIGAKEGWKKNIQRDETGSGLVRLVKNGEARRIRKYQLKDIESTQKTNLESWISHVDGIKSCWVLDHYGNLIFMELLNDLELNYSQDDPLYGCDLDLLEVL